MVINSHEPQTKRRMPSKRLILGLAGLLASSALCLASYSSYTSNSKSIDELAAQLESEKELLITSDAAIRDTGILLRRIANVDKSSATAYVDIFLFCRNMTKRSQLFSKEIREEGVIALADNIDSKAAQGMNTNNEILFKLTGHNTKALSELGITSPEEIATFSKKGTSAWRDASRRTCGQTLATYQEIGKSLAPANDIRELSEKTLPTGAHNSALRALQTAWLVQIVALLIANIVDVDLNLPF